MPTEKAGTKIHLYFIQANIKFHVDYGRYVIHIEEI